MARIVIIETNDAAELQAITTELKIHSIFCNSGDTVVVKEPPKPKEKPATPQDSDKKTKRKKRLQEIYEEAESDNPTAGVTELLNATRDRWNLENEKNAAYDDISTSTVRRILNE